MQGLSRNGGRTGISIADNEGDRRFFTRLHVLLNLNIRASRPSDTQRAYDLLERYRRSLGRLEIVQRVFNPYDADQDTFNISGGTPETGNDPRGRRPHIHFSLSSRHVGRWSLQQISRELQTYTREWLTQNGHNAGFFLTLRLDPASYKEHYDKKGVLYPNGHPGSSFGRLFPGLQGSLRGQNSSSRPRLPL